MIYETIRTQLSGAVPFAHHAGIVLDEVAQGRAVASLPFRAEGLNHIGTQHAGALFTAGEAASGAAMAGAFAPVLMRVKPVAIQASIRYLKAAKGGVRAEASVLGEPEGLLQTLHAEGKVVFTVQVHLLDSTTGEKLGEMTVEWHVTNTNKPQQTPTPA